MTSYSNPSYFLHSNGLLLHILDHHSSALISHLYSTHETNISSYHNAFPSNTLETCFQDYFGPLSHSQFLISTIVPHNLINFIVWRFCYWGLVAYVASRLPWILGSIFFHGGKVHVTNVQLGYSLCFRSDYRVHPTALPKRKSVLYSGT